MSDTVILVEKLSKSYLIGHQGPKESYQSLRDTLSLHAKNFARRTVDTFRGKQMLQGDSVEEFWALKDVSFEVKQGDVVGIIGRNGAGKSTLLKVLSRITEPTGGRVTIDGRVASLLEVGTGFHPELTGRENIFLNGAILGMGRREIKAKFDEIVAFAGVERFLDTPVKRYSSGMYVRLAFAVAAHLETEILIVDEVLAVGDAEFQRKCMGKMQDVASGGKTVIFVSHNMAAISTLTKSCIYLAGGEIKYSGPTQVALNNYLGGESQKEIQYQALPKNPDTPYVESIRLITKSGGSCHQSGDDIQIEVTIDHLRPHSGLCFSFNILNYNQQKIAHFWIYDNETPVFRHGSKTTLTCSIPNLRLNVGNYSLAVYLAEPPGGRVFDIQEGICHFECQIIGKQTLFGWRQEVCSFLLDHTWKTETSEFPVIF